MERMVRVRFSWSGFLRTSVMALHNPTMADGALEECMDEINEFVATLQRFPPTVIAVAMSVHLQTLLSALVEGELCTRAQVGEFVRELQHDVLEELGETPPAEDARGLGQWGLGPLGL
jgi:hypothetical protein